VSDDLHLDDGVSRAAPPLWVTASPWLRVGATFIDAAFLGLLLSAVHRVVLTLVPGAPLMSLVAVLVAQWLAGCTARQTVGKCCLGLSIVAADGSPGQLGRHCLRALLKSAWWMLGLVGLLLLAFAPWSIVVFLLAAWAAHPLCMLARRDHRALHDVLSGTMVAAGHERRKWHVLALTPAVLVLTLVAWGAGVGSVARIYGPFTSESMRPTVLAGDLVLAVRPGRLAVGDLVMHRPPPEANLGEKPFLRRVVAVSGEPAPRTPGPYWRNRDKAGPAGRTDLIVPPGHLWVLGDNRRVAVDSDDFGPVSEKLVQGRVVAIVWPPGRIRRLDLPQQ